MKYWIFSIVNDERMQFLCYRRNDISTDYDGVCLSRLVLDDDSILEFSGWISYSSCIVQTAQRTIRSKYEGPTGIYRMRNIRLAEPPPHHQSFF